MRKQPSQRARRDAANGKRLLIAAALILFAGLFVQITMLAQITSAHKQASALEREIAELAASTDNLERTISNYHNLTDIEYRATQLGMRMPTDDQIRTVRVE